MLPGPVPRPVGYLQPDPRDRVRFLQHRAHLGDLPGQALPLRPGPHNVRSDIRDVPDPLVPSRMAA